MDMQLTIKDLAVKTIIGIYPEERTRPQEILFTVNVTFDGAAAATSDAIETTVDYYQLSEEIATFVEGTNHLLLERLINDVADLIMAHSLITSCSVDACKTEIQTRAKAIHLTIQKKR